MAYKKKLIEVALPLEAINAESAREKSIRHGHPSSLHLWWARRPLATARAVIWSSLVDDPSSHPDLFPTEELQRKERERLFGILSRLVVWENSSNSEVLSEAKVEIMRSTGGNPPALLDPFAGGGAIPLEAQRLGLEAHAHDLNPVAVMINKSMIEIPAKFANQQPINPEARATLSGNSWTGVAGIAEDIRYYGEWMKKKAFEKIGYLYPTIKAENGKESIVIAWIWARTVKCPNPACGVIIPMASNFILSKKAGAQVWTEPVYKNGNLQFVVHHGKVPSGKETNKAGKSASFVCPCCKTITEREYVVKQAAEGKMGAAMMAVVAEGERGREYYSPDYEQIKASEVEKPEYYPTGRLSEDKRAISPPAYGIENIEDLFTSRQLNTLCVFSELVSEAQDKAEKDAVTAGMYNDHIGLADNGVGARAYGESIGVYLSFLVDKLADLGNSLNRWEPIAQCPRQLFARQAIPMIWDYAEANAFSNSSGSWQVLVNNLYNCFRADSFSFRREKIGYAKQFDAQSDCGLRGIMVSTDPPYYDNIGYADLSDFFYVWMRQSLKKTYPKLFRTMLVPKAEELVAVSYRFDGNMEAAKDYFEKGMFKMCCQLMQYVDNDIPTTLYYAFKQSENESSDTGTQTASSGWETMLNAIIQAGFMITGTWPMRTECGSRMRGQDSNALASSIVLVFRKRDENAKNVTRREFINTLHREMRPALEALQSANIAPVDLAQSAIGPGIGVYSRYKNVIEADGSSMSVRAALQIINQELDAFYNEQEGELDAKSRFCVDIFNQYAFNSMRFGDADILARAKNTSVQALVDEGVMEAAKGSVRLKTREEIPERIDSNEDCCWKITQQLARAFERGGVKECATAVVNLKGYIAENAKSLAYRLYTICERKNWAAEGYAYNNLIVAWSDIQNEAANLQAEQPVQMSILDL